MKKLTLTQLIASAALCVSALGHSATARDWKTISESGTIQVVTEGAFYPFNHFEGTTLTGFEVELAEAVVKKMGLKLEWRVVPFDAQVASIRQGRYDFAIASHGFTEERNKSVDFAKPHYCSGGQIAAYKDGPLTVAALKGRVVGVQLATSYADATKKIDGLKEVKNFSKDTEAFQALRAKKVDAWISDRFLINATLRKNADSGIVAGENVFTERVSAIFRKGDKELIENYNKALEAVMKDGTYQRLSQKYFNEDIACRS